MSVGRGWDCVWTGDEYECGHGMGMYVGACMRVYVCVGVGVCVGMGWVCVCVGMCLDS